MSSVAKSFTATGVSAELTFRPGQGITYAVSGTFVGTVKLERAVNNGAAAYETLATATAAATGSYTNESKRDVRVRFNCTAFTSGTIVTAIGDANPNSEKRLISAAGQGKVGGTAGFVVAVADNVALVTCPASQTASKLVVPVPTLKVGERITGFHAVGQIESGGGTATFDLELRKMTAAAADVSDASVASITQLSVAADTIISASNSRKAALDQVVATDESYYFLVTVTTAAATDVALQAIAIEVAPAG